MNDIVVIDHLTHIYPPTRKQKQPRTAINDLSLSITEGEMFSFLGPNGSGKSTLFRILSTILLPSNGNVTMFGADLRTGADRIRHSLGIVFQHPSLDIKLTAKENLAHQGHLYNLMGNQLDHRIEETLTLVGLLDRANELVENLSGGMRRRIELAKSLLHKPPLLLLDEPSTGLDPGARKEFGGYLEHLRTNERVTILLTTHILEEADRCDRLAILDQGKLVALGSPAELKNEIGGDVITLRSKDAAKLSADLTKRFPGTAHVFEDTVRFERPHGHEFIPQLVEAFPGQIEAITISKPTLEDVYIDKTGRSFWDEVEA